MKYFRFKMGGVLDEVNSNQVNMLLYLKVNPKQRLARYIVYSFCRIGLWPTVLSFFQPIIRETLHSALIDTSGNVRHTCLQSRLQTFPPTHRSHI